MFGSVIHQHFSSVVQDKTCWQSSQCISLTHIDKMLKEAQILP
ncbi:hypothetical protein PAUR_a3278 [Pseudoalteromonas aurantia 208]|uniref:Uncharacterized protein n=1 Tax=Pseudoalteromonas aurantia 208 TaxID=1314867 RepID=A0ABR9E5M5_9GAMM|nr:hypothetical protein [Pseudoalteromonas aurantia 208]